MAHFPPFNTQKPCVADPLKPTAATKSVKSPFVAYKKLGGTTSGYRCDKDTFISTFEECEDARKKLGYTKSVIVNSEG